VSRCEGSEATGTWLPDANHPSIITSLSDIKSVSARVRGTQHANQKSKPGTVTPVTHQKLSKSVKGLGTVTAPNDKVTISNLKGTQTQSNAGLSLA